MLLQRPKLILMDGGFVNRRNIQNVIRNPFKNKSNENFQTQNTNDIIIKSVNDAVDFINTTYGHNYKNFLPIQIIGEIPKNKTGIEDLGAVYRQDQQIDSSDGIIQLSTDFLTQQNKYSNNQFSKFLKEKLGLSGFTKLVSFHEIGHHMDFLMSNNMLVAIQDRTYQKIDNLNFLNEKIYQDFLNSWVDSKSIGEKHDNVNNYLKRNLKENVADCWSCILLSQESKKNGFHIKNIIAILKEARAIDGRTPETIYSTFNALDRLLINLKLIHSSKPQDFVSIVQKSAQEGLILNFKEIIENKNYSIKKKEILEAIHQNTSENNIEDKIKDTAKRLKL